MSSQVRFNGAGAGARRPTEPTTEAEFDRPLAAIPAGRTDFGRALSDGRCDLMSTNGNVSERWKGGFCVGGLAKE